MTAAQIEATELINQINETAEKLSALIESDLEKLNGYALTIVTSALDEKGKLSVKSFLTGKRSLISNAQKELMMKRINFFRAIFYALKKAYKHKSKLL
ncbi:MAG: hypothetical protein C4308_14990, partial [Chitinophagaceae bacterium]